MFLMDMELQRTDSFFGGNHKEWILYICDHYWALDIDDYVEFYYNPERGLGKILKSELPDLLFEKAVCCFRQ